MDVMEDISRYDIQRNILKMILPIMASNILEMLVGFVSMALIGDLGFIAIGAMGLSTRVRGIIWSVFKGISIGAQVVVAQAYGANDHDRIKETLRQTVISIFLLSILFVLSMWIFPEQWLIIFGAKGELLLVGSSILRTVSLGLPFLGIVIVVSGVLQGKGDAVRPLIIGTVMNVLNGVLGIVLVGEMGLEGAALAMTFSQMIAAILAIWIIRKELAFNKLFIFTKGIIRSVYVTGIPSALESLFWEISTIMIIRAILMYGEDVYAAYQLGLQAESISFMPAAGFGVAATTYIGHYLGANDRYLAKRYFKEIMKGSLILSLISGGILVFFPTQLLRIMTSDLNLIKIATVYLIICGIAQVPQNIAGVFSGALRGAGYTKAPMYSAAIGLYGFRVPLALFATYYFHWSVDIIFLAIGLDMCIRFIINIWLYFKTDIYNNPRFV